MEKIRDFDKIHQEICRNYLENKDLLSSLPLDTQIELVNNSNYLLPSKSR